MSHELGSILIIIHPPLAILGYLFTFLAAWNMGKLLFRRKDRKRDNRDFGLSLAVAWWLTFLGLVTASYIRFIPNLTSGLCPRAAITRLLARSRSFWFFQADQSQNRSVYRET